MNVLEVLSSRRTQAKLYEEVCPEEMHAVKDKSHDQEVAVLETNHVPLVLRSGLVGVDIGQETEWEDNDPEVYPNENHYNVDDGHADFRHEFGLKESPSESSHDVTGVMDNQDH